MTRASKTAKTPSRAAPTPASHTDTASAPNSPNAAWFWPILLIAAGIVVYADSLRGVFLFDDTNAIVDNLRIRHLWPLGSLLATERPVVELSFALNYAIGELNVVGYHVLNIAVHLSAGLTLFGLVRRTIFTHAECGTRNAGKRAAPSSPASPRVHNSTSTIAFAVALLWLVHPLQTESVTYIIQRAESMMGLFYLLTLYAFVRGVQSRRPWWLVGSVIACALAMGSKAVAITAPIMVLLYDRCFIAGGFADALRRRWAYYVGLAAAWSVLFFSGIVQHVLTPTPGWTTVGLGFKGFSPLQYAWTQSQVLLHYLRLSFWPHPLCIDYSWPIVQRVGDVVIPLAIVAGLIAATLWGLWKRHGLGFVGAWVFVILSPTSSLVPVRDVAFEHRMYLPLAGLIVIVVSAIVRARRLVAKIASSNRPPHPLSGGGGGVWRIGGAVILLAASVALGAATVRRNHDYHDALAMWTDVARLRPDNARAYVHIAWWLEKRGEVEAAINAYRKALALYPDFAIAHYNMALALRGLHRTQEAEAAFRESLRLTPENPIAHLNLAGILVERGDLEGAAAEYRAILKSVPDDAEAAANLANALRRLDRPAEAMELAKFAVQTSPQSAAAHEALAHTFLAQGDMASAVVEFRQAAQLDPTNITVRVNLGTALKVEGRIDEAIEAYRDAIRIDARSFFAHFQLADALMEQGRHQDAIVEFEAALQLSPRDADAHVALGNALRAVGRTAEAVEHFRHALTASPNRTDARNALSEMGVIPGP